MKGPKTAETEHWGPLEVLCRWFVMLVWEFRDIETE